MPNWCEGNIRLRGTKKNIIDFITNEIVCTKYDEETDDYIEEKPLIEKDVIANNVCSINLAVPSDCSGGFYFRNTYRNFIFSSETEICFPDSEDDEEIVVCIDDFNAAWSLKDAGWIEHAMKYNIDIRIFGFEHGMEFSQILTISREGEADCKTTEYSDWFWDCPFPNLGG